MENRINSKSDLKDWIKYEKNKYENVSLLFRLFNIGEGAILYKHQVILRKAEFYHNTNKKLMEYLYRIRLYRIQNKYSLHIPINTCGRGLKIMHIGPILINGRARLGTDCSLHINSAVVAKGSSDEVPFIGNGVVIGVGAVIVGGISVVNNVAIGANSVVTKSINEENVAVAGIPARKVSNSGSLRWGNDKPEK